MPNTFFAFRGTPGFPGTQFEKQWIIGWLVNNVSKGMRKDVVVG
jgi:hypothetical protein